MDKVTAKTFFDRKRKGEKLVIVTAYDYMSARIADEVGIDALHAFEDVSYPVTRYKGQWGERIGIMGGVDVDKLARFDEDSLRRYVREILDSCMQGGRYVFGSGNSITNYVPVENFIIMIDEGLKWGG